MITHQKEADALLQDFWDLNAKYPEYVTCVRFDHVSPPFHDMEECKLLFLQKLVEASDAAAKDLTTHFEIAIEDGLPVQDILKARKLIRGLKSIDISSVTTIDDLVSKKPHELEAYWRK